MFHKTFKSSPPTIRYFLGAYVQLATETGTRKKVKQTENSPRGGHIPTYVHTVQGGRELNRAKVEKVNKEKKGGSFLVLTLRR